MQKQFMMLLVAGSLASGLAADHRGEHPRERCVTISEQQRESIRAIRERERPLLQALHQRAGDAALQYRRLADAGDPGAARALERLRDLRDQMRGRRLALKAEVGQVLTAEQRERMQRCREGRRERRLRR